MLELSVPVFILTDVCLATNYPLVKTRKRDCRRSEKSVSSLLYSEVDERSRRVAWPSTIQAYRIVAQNGYKSHLFCAANNAVYRFRNETAQNKSVLLDGTDWYRKGSYYLR